jgi:PPP family 3-phenylpropionic acid transporter
VRSGSVLSLFYFVTFAAFGVFHPFLPTWLAARGIDGVELGVVAALRPVMGVMAPIAFGILADTLGLRGSLLRVAAIGTVGSIAVMSLITAFDPNPSFAAVAAFMVVFSFFRAPMFSLADVAALEGDTSYGRQRLWGSWGFLVAALAGGGLVNASLPLPFPLTVTAVLALALIPAFMLPKRASVPPQPVAAAAKALFGSRRFQLFLFALFLWQGSHAAYDLCISLHLASLGASQGFIGLAWGVGTFAETVVMVRSGPVIARYGTERLLLVGMALTALRWLLIAVVREPYALLALQPLHAASFGLVFVVALEHVKLRAEPHVIGTAQGTFAAVTGVGAALSMVVWGTLIHEAGGTVVFFGAAGLAVLAGLAVAPLVFTREAEPRAPA